MNKLSGIVRAAIEKYHMIDEGDRVAVGVSGGKDSLALLCCLAEISRYYPKKFTIEAITADPQMNGTETDFSAVEALCKDLSVNYTIKRTQTGKIIFEDRKEKNPCSMCARMRRGILHKMAKELNCNKIALGHHYDDAVQTFFMNLLDGGKIGCFSPVTYLSNRDLYLIRPLIFCEEKAIIAAVNRNNLPVVKSECPVDGKTERKNVDLLIKNLEETYPDLKAKVIGAMQRADISSWGID